MRFWCGIKILLSNLATFEISETVSTSPKIPGLFYCGVLFLIVQDDYTSSSDQIEVLQFIMEDAVKKDMKYF